MKPNEFYFLKQYFAMTNLTSAVPRNVMDVYRFPNPPNMSPIHKYEMDLTRKYMAKCMAGYYGNVPNWSPKGVNLLKKARKMAQ